MTKTKTPEVTPEEDATNTVPGIDLQDIANALNLVTVAIKRGTYERSELREVLDTTDKLEKFLSYQAASQASQHSQKGEQ
jgi:hypothetical protein